MELRVENVLKSKRKAEIKKIYFEAFPKSERMPFPLMLALSLLWNTQFLAFYDGDVLCGLVYQATVFRQTFIMFFAVDESLRSKGYGSKILSAVQAAKPKNKIIVSIEPTVGNPENLSQRVRRKNFYKRNGYAESGYYMKLGGTWQEILIANGQFKRWKFMLFFLVYGCGAVFPRIWKSEKYVK